MDQNGPLLATRVLRDVDPWLFLEVALVVLAATAAVIVIERATAFLAERASALPTAVRDGRPAVAPRDHRVALATVIGMLIKPTPENWWPCSARWPWPWASP